ncbi:MAG: HTTM domain-containing protein [Myxococcales bacterium]|nr:MAG: HTTM domain-containing protein [Myxococcales bacterium]
MLFAAVMFSGLVRFLLQGWVDTLYVQPTFFFHYDGFSWVRVWPEWGIYLHYALLMLLALFIGVGFMYRLSCALFFLAFSYLQLMDVSNYLNHYYLVALLALLLCFLPAHHCWSVDAWLFPKLREDRVAAWTIYLLRFQIALVYLYAALAKVNSDWLLYAQPLGLWMGARTHLPIIGPFLGAPWVAYLLSWAGFLYDASIVFWLSWRRSRPFAYLVVLAFHAMTYVFFSIGMVPFIMSSVTLIFFSPSWPRILLQRMRRFFPKASKRVEPRSFAMDSGAIRAPAWTLHRRLGAMALLAYLVFQTVFPLRHFAYPGNVLWNEEGMRFAWKVMVREKNGSITYFVQPRGRLSARSSGASTAKKRYQVSPHDYLTFRQAQEMSSQPDLIVKLAEHIADDFQRRGFGAVDVYAEALVSLNGRAPALLLDPSVDLSKGSAALKGKDWILPEPNTAPIRLASR